MMKKNMFVCCTALVLCCRFFTGCQMETKPPSVFELAKETEERAEQQRKLPEVPALPVITASNSRLTVTWRAAERAEYYEVFYAAESTPPESPARTTYETSAAITGLANGTTYYVWVRAGNSHGTSAMSRMVSGTPVAPTNPPAAPGELSVTAEDGRLVITWTPVAMADSYEVYYSTSTTLPAVPAKTETEASSIISELVNGTRYYIWVKAVNTFGSSAESPRASGTPLETTAPPAAPTAPLVSTGDRQLTVSWAAVSGAASYEVWYGTGGDATAAAKYGETSELSVTISGLTNGTAYYVWVRAKNGYGASGFSARAAGTPDIPRNPPAVPEISAVTPGNGQLTVSWTAATGAASYEVYCDTGPSPGIPAQTVTVPGAVITGLVNGTRYNIRIKAVNNAGASNYSAVVTGRPMGNPGALTAAGSDGKLTVSWTAVAGADSYDVYCGVSTTEPSQPVPGLTALTGTSAEITGLLNGTVYYVWIKAKQDGGAVSEFSPRASAKPQIIIPAGLYDNGKNAENKIGDQNLETASTWLNTNAESGHTYYIVLGADEETYSLNFNYPGKTVAIEISGSGAERTVTLSADAILFTVNSGVTLTLSDQVTLRGRSGNNSYRLISVLGGALIMQDGAKVTGNGGGGVSVNKSSSNVLGTFTMNGGEISGHNYTGSSTSTYGGGVAVSAGTFTMHGGEIKNNTGRAYGAGVGLYTSDGNVSFVIDGGKISGNTATDSGGGVYVERYGSYSYTATFTMSGTAVINDNTAANGGGVYIKGYDSVYGALFVMNSGEISGNTASSTGSSLGGGVCLYNSANFTMNGGKISGNTAKKTTSGAAYGGGVYGTNYSSFTMNGGEISGNTATNSSSVSHGNGGGVYGSGTFTKSSTGTAVIYGSNASTELANSCSGGTSYGHAVYVYRTGGSSKKRNTTARAIDALDSAQSGAAGGWE